MICSIELWFRYLAFVIRCLSHGTSPFTIFGKEALGRALFSGHVKIKASGAKLFPNAFLINSKSESGISVSRISLAPIRLFGLLGAKAAGRRSIKFYGFAEFNAEALSGITLDDGYKLLVEGAPTLENPFHADIPLPADRGKDYYVFVATEFIKCARFKSVDTL